MVNRPIKIMLLIIDTNPLTLVVCIHIFLSYHMRQQEKLNTIINRRLSGAHGRLWLLCNDFENIAYNDLSQI